MPKISDMKISFKNVFLIFSFIMLLPAFSCKPKLKGAAQSQKNIEKMQEERKKEAEKEFEMAQKRHMEIQTKETRKRMKQSKKKSERLMAGKPEHPWYKRIFLPKQKKTKRKPSKN